MDNNKDNFDKDQKDINDQDNNNEQTNKEQETQKENDKKPDNNAEQAENDKEKEETSSDDKSNDSNDDEKEDKEKKEKTIEDVIREKQNEIREKLKEEEERNRNTRKLPKGFGGKFNFKGLVLLAFIIAAIMSIPAIRREQTKVDTKDISYTEFIADIKDSKIDRIEEKDEYVLGYMKDSQEVVKARLVTVRLGFDEKLLTLLMDKNVKITSLPPEEPNAIVSMLISWIPFLLFIGIWIFMLNRMNRGNGGGPQIFNMGKSKTKDGENISKVTFKDVAGITESKKELEEVVEFLREPEKFRKVGAKIPKGVLLLGAPGTGKTLLAKAVAGEAKVPFFSMSGSEFVEMFVGVGASRVRDLFNKARKSAPCIVFIDEIDAVGRKRGTGSGGGNDEREQTLNQLLVEMDGFGNEETIIVLAATNRPDVLDKALMRPGRFDRRVYIDMPDRKGRVAILKVHSKGKMLGKDVDLDAIAKQTSGLSGADLANLLNEAAILAARANRTEISMADIQEATEKAEMGPAKKSKVVSDAERRLTAFHEAGHAVVRYSLPGSEPVYKITIVPRGFAGGYTMYLPDEEQEREYRLKGEYLNDIKSCFGGRAAEEVVLNDISGGASSDIQRATAIAQAMVTKLGMSNKFGPILLDNTQEGDMFQSKNYSDSTGKEVDDEVRGILQGSYKETVEIIKNHRKELEDVAQALLEKETIGREEFEAIMKGEISENTESQNS